MNRHKCLLTQIYALSNVFDLAYINIENILINNWTCWDGIKINCEGPLQGKGIESAFGYSLSNLKKKLGQYGETTMSSKEI